MRQFNKLVSYINKNKIKPLTDNYVENIDVIPRFSSETISSINSICSTIHTLNYNYVKACIICDDNLNIIEISDNFLSLTHYTKNELIGQFIGILMSKLLAQLHKNIFLKKFKNSSEFEQKQLLNKLYGHNKRREVIIYDKFKNPRYVDLSINAIDNNNYLIELNYNLNIDKN